MYVYIYNCYILLINWPLYHYIVAYFVLWQFLTYSLFVRCKYSHPCSLSVTIGMEYLLSALHFQSMYVLKAKVGLLWAAYYSIFFFSIHSATLYLLTGEFNPLKVLLIGKDLQLSFKKIVFWLFNSFPCSFLSCLLSSFVIWWIFS